MYPSHYRPGVIAFLCLFLTRVVQCTGGDLQDRGESVGMSLLPRTIPDGNGLVNFDDMPTCARESCYPFDNSNIGCPDGDLRKSCFCGYRGHSYCGQEDCDGEDEFLFWQWLAVQCLGATWESFSRIPTCAQTCIQLRYIENTCSLNSYGCFCTGEFDKECYKDCSSSDLAIMENWKDEQCAAYRDTPSASGASGTAGSATRTGSIAGSTGTSQNKVTADANQVDNSESSGGVGTRTGGGYMLT